jgi:hypothetical protein
MFRRVSHKMRSIFGQNYSSSTGNFSGSQANTLKCSYRIKIAQRNILTLHSSAELEAAEEISLPSNRESISIPVPVGLNQKILE